MDVCIMPTRRIRKINQITEKNRARARLKVQIADMRVKDRQLLGHWVRLDSVPTTLPATKMTPSGARGLASRKELFRRQTGKEMTSVEIHRVGNVERQRKRPGSGIGVMSLPLAETPYFTHLAGVTSDEAHHWRQRNRKLHEAARRSNKLGELVVRRRKLFDRAHAELPFNIGINCILEVGRDSTGQPTHILLTRRPATVPAEPLSWDFPAGLWRKGQSPLDALNSRIQKELGISTEKLQIVGPDLKPVHEPVYLTVQRNNELLNYNPVIVQRAEVDVRKLKRHMKRFIESGKKTKDPFRPVGFVLLRRDPAVIRDFIRRHKMFMPEVLRLYGQELYKNSASRMRGISSS